jgi:hypothetical protein
MEENEPATSDVQSELGVTITLKEKVFLLVEAEVEVIVTGKVPDEVRFIPKVRGVEKVGVPLIVAGVRVIPEGRFTALMVTGSWAPDSYSTETGK